MAHTPESVSENQHIAEPSKPGIKCKDIGRNEGPPLKGSEVDSEGADRSDPPSTESRVFYISRDVTAPELICHVEAEYTEEARQAKYQGTVVLSLVVQRDGSVRDIKVLLALKYGLTEKAMEAVLHWRFRPGMKNGTPVDVRKIVEVIFRLM